MPQFLSINGFHTGVAGRFDGIGDFLYDLDAAGVPFFAKCVDGTTSLLDAQRIMRASRVPHHAVFRRAHFPHNQGGSDVPDYTLSPAEAARRQWEAHVAQWPPELDPTLIFGETVNELRREVAWADWIGEFCYHTALLALAQGWKWCGPGFAAGTPDEGAWETPGMRKFLRLAAAHPQQLAIALHEYSYDADDILAGGGRLVGRVSDLADACAAQGIRPPTVFFTEWGWNERGVPGVETALAHIRQAGALYARYPNIKGAAIWALDGGWGDLAQQAHRLMQPLKRLLIETRDHEADAPPPPERPEPRRIAYVTRLLPQDTTLEELRAVTAALHPQRNSFTFSHDEAYAAQYFGATRARLILYAPERWDFDVAGWFRERGVAVEEARFNGAGALSVWPTRHFAITQRFGANPAQYAPFGLPGHEGIDLICPLGDPVFAAAAGRVARAGDRRSDGSASAYGWHVILDHGGGLTTLYAHLQPRLPVETGMEVRAGETLGYSGSSGNSSGPHLHFTVKQAGAQTGAFPPGYVDPLSLLAHLYWRAPQPPLMAGWLWLDSLDLSPDGTRAVCRGALNLRETPDVSAPLLGRTARGEAVQLVGRTAGGYARCQLHDPRAGLVDMAAYFTAAGGRGSLFILRNNWGAAPERVQLQNEGVWSYVVKNQQFERRRILADRIAFDLDTSPGDGRYYRIESATGWMPRRWRPGDTFQRSEHVRFFTKHDCAPVPGSTYSSTSILAFAALHAAWTSPAGIALRDVIEVHWLLHGRVEEKYWYAPRLGLVAWENAQGRASHIAELIPAGEQADNVREQGCFS